MKRKFVGYFMEITRAEQADSAAAKIYIIRVHKLIEFCMWLTNLVIKLKFGIDSTQGLFRGHFYIT